MKKIIFPCALVFSLISSNCLSKAIIFLDDLQLKAIEVASIHFRKKESREAFNIMMIDDSDNIKITFYLVPVSKETRGGGGEQITYIISKANFNIEDIKMSHSK